ncbi:phospholipase A2 inhibitor and Ly6/PLAUR domain-containing protein-like [Podarcis raffonei]|uniref:phospholipase A2 inhibitor and Ly6/PLAUR domain-containing protein-like n=1 Tax=Podarcis raffonei TaxID=65483 RepID=UPI0023299731|nr:phospholipase A2 inhibitor and Ly6/PLAUR domain-containing protein-like [Podarcis raffonei]
MAGIRISKPLPASSPLLIHPCSESPNHSRMLKALLSACLLLAPLSADKPEVQIENTCLSSRYCFSGDYSFTAADGKFFEMKAQCCNTDLCNNETLSLPDRNMLAENGLRCPSCFSKGRKKCKSEKTVNCLENETQCVDFRGALITGIFSPMLFTFKGCATTNFCAIRKNGGSFIGTRRIVLPVYEESCYNASRISHQPEQEG